MNRPFHPILFALYPVLALYSVNTALIPVAEVGLPLVLVLALCAVVWGVLSLVLRSVSRAAVGTSIAIVGFFANGHLWDVLSQVKTIRNEFGDREGMFLTWLILWIVAVIFACWKWKRGEGVTRAMNVVGIVPAGFPAVSIGMSWFSAWRGTAVVEAVSNSAKLDTSVRPDIYYIILDGYGRSDALKRVIGFSNEWFVKDLENLGFFVAKDGRSNYCETELSLSSSLNLQYLSALLPKIGPNDDDRQALDALIDRNEVSKYLKRLGYKYVAMTTGFPSIHPASADIWLRDQSGVSLFSNELLTETPLPTDQYCLIRRCSWFAEAC